MVHQDIGRKLLDRVSTDLGTAFGGRAEPAHGRQADDHGLCTEEEVTLARAARPCGAFARSGCRSERLANGAIQRGVKSMPKLKTNRAAAKRFRKTAKGFKRYSANRRHNLGHKDPQGQTPGALRRLESRGQDRCRSSRAAAALSPLSEHHHGTSEAWRDGRAPSQESSWQGEGLLQRPAQGLSRGQAGRHQGRAVRLPRPAAEQARVPRAVDHAHQRRGAHVRACPTAASSTA